MSIELSDQELGERIRGRRIAQGLRQSAFVGSIISAGYISLIESGQRRPSPVALDHILSVLGLTLEQLLGATPSVFTPQMRQVIGQAEDAMRRDNPREAIRLCNTLSKSERMSPRVIVVESEAHFVMGEIERVFSIAPQATLDLIEDRTWDYARRGMIVFTRATSYASLNIESMLFMIRVRKLLQEISSPDDLFVLQHAASLSGHLAEVGDLNGAHVALEKVKELAQRVKDFRAKASLHWATAVCFVEQDKYEDALREITKAKELFDAHGDIHDRRRILTVLASIVSEGIPVEHSIVDEVMDALGAEINNTGVGSDIEVVAEIKLLLAKFLIKRSQTAKAAVLMDEISKIHKLSDDQIAQLNLCRALGELASGDKEAARKYLNSSFETAHRADSSSSSATTFREIADVFQMLDDHGKALAVLREANTRKSNLYALLTSELYSS